MSEHYFSQNPQSKSSPRKWKYELKGNLYTFASDIGVFSKDEVDFGSRLLIEKFKEPSVAGDFLDLGCGYGPIGIALADHHKERNILMSDVNERALILAQQNAEINDVKNVEITQSDRLTNIENRSIAAIITNPPIRAGKKVVHQMFEESQAALIEHGELWVVIQKKQGAPSAKEKIEYLFGNAEVVARDKGYFILRATKYLTE
ncbi:16S rRNA methyltransferase [Virgibacillus profundi]|uniref:16S rRNA methyltransferase n=1 Tax=Virgibacillus profundi TaxID=2024555 RepID=A0A2A2I9V0_9BACI|nr:class I SAM-dependent methyltransferase [Virgibacillus profundi]PAV27910.1 16S rRNA methyltransferase [Virgibacillus profundi]PXY52088.1 class I SAM-dependent methyltransferase [Virgibacillus profundi]